jgi:hypothetical protein
VAERRAVADVVLFMLTAPAQHDHPRRRDAADECRSVRPSLLKKTVPAWAQAMTRRVMAQSDMRGQCLRRPGSRFAHPGYGTVNEEKM